MNMPVHIVIVGSGAVGAFYGSRLHSPDKNIHVSVICRSNYSAVQSRNGFSMKTHSYGDYNFTPHAIFKSVDDAANSNLQWDYVVVTTKALPDISDDSKLIEKLISSKTSIVLIQNGVGIERPYQLRYKNTPILSAVTVISAAQTEPGVIVQNRWTRISIGPFQQDDDGKTAHFVGLLQAGGVKDAELYDAIGIQLVRWHKLAINASMNPSSVLSNGTGNAAMALDSELRIHLKACMEEILETAPKILSRPFPGKFATADQILKSTERNTAGRPSMLLDWESNKPMELEAILGNPIRIARQHGYEMPRLQTMYALLSMAQKQRQKAAKL